MESVIRGASDGNVFRRFYRTVHKGGGVGSSRAREGRELRSFC